MASTSNVLTDIIVEAPTLCNLLNSHINKLIEFNDCGGAYADININEEEAAAYEDKHYFFCLQMICMAKPLLAPPLPLTLPPPPRRHLCRCHHQTRFFP